MATRDFMGMEPGPRRTKKAQILSFYTSGVTDINELAEITDARPSYVASVLQESGFLSGYFDLYTHLAHPMNVYSRFFSGKLGFRDEEVTREGIKLLERFYQEFRSTKDRAGQHHALTVALTMFDRARWIGKSHEAELYRDWLVDKLNEDISTKPEREVHNERHGQRPARSEEIRSH